MISTNRQAGFTLIELMIVVAIIAILAGIAYPSYMEHVRKTRRSAAAACLTERAQYMERSYTTNMTYPAAVPNTGCVTDLTAYYTFTDPTVGSGGGSYSLAAVPGGAQASDKCGTLSLTQTGVKSVSTSVPVAQCF